MPILKKLQCLMFVLGLCFLMPLLTQTVSKAETLQEKSVVELERLAKSIDQQLQQLAQYNLRSGLGAIGFRSKAHNEANHKEWFEIRLDAEHRIDEVILVPNVLRDQKFGFVGDAFSTDFRIVIGSGEGENRKEVASFHVGKPSEYRIAPIVVATNQEMASWVRIEVDELPQRKYDKKYVFQLAEVMIFSGHDNIALHQNVEVSSNEPTGSPAWDKSYAVDGYVPYLMNSPVGDGALPFVSGIGVGPEPSITIDLELEADVSRMNLHLVDQSDTVPQTFGGDFGVPRLIRVEGARLPDFSDAQTLCESKHTGTFDCGPIVMLRFSPRSCRYIRLTALEPYMFFYQASQPSGSRIGFAEIEIFAEEKNLALNKKASGNFVHSARELEPITDGSNRYGNVLPIHDWLSELSVRHDLESKRPKVLAELAQRYQGQRRNLNWMIGLAGALAVIAIGTALVGWISRYRAVQTIREQIAADLHDELGANFHAMGLISDVANESVSDPEKLRPLLERMRELTVRSGKAAMYCANMLESKGLYDNLLADMKRTAKRITADLEHQFVVSGEEHLNLGTKKRIGVFLFYKECLANALRHSNATHLTTTLTIGHREISLEVSDNGIGLPNTSPGKVDFSAIPKSLRRRARLTGGKVTSENLASGGTKIMLNLYQ